MRIATRGSELALAQSRQVADLLARVLPGTSCRMEVVRTEGDRRNFEPIWAIGGKGVFVREVQRAVLDRRADVAVHSAKDLPSTPTPGLVIAAIPPRGDPRDALVGARLEDLPPGAVVATGSPRRRAQLAWARPDLLFRELRGNMHTRLAGLDRADAIVAAVAALERLGLSEKIAEPLDPSRFVPQAGQGALAVECREDDEELVELLRMLDHRPSRLCVEAERAYLARLGGDCDLPAGAFARSVDGDELELVGFVARLDGHSVARRSVRGREPIRLGSELAEELITCLDLWRPSAGPTSWLGT